MTETGRSTTKGLMHFEAALSGYLNRTGSNCPGGHRDAEFGKILGFPALGFGNCAGQSLFR